jgi:DNA-binding response OmpR family regulator
MNRNVLLVGRKAIVLDDVREGLAVQDVTLFSATTLDDVRKVLDEHAIDMVIMGAGIDLDTRLQIVRHIFEASSSTTVHLKDRDSGPQGFLPFVKGLLERPV